MSIDTRRIVSLSETDQSVAEIARMVEQFGSAVVALNNTPRYLVIELNQDESALDASDDTVSAVSRQLIERNRAVYQELAK